MSQLQYTRSIIIYIYNTPNGIKEYKGIDRYNWEVNRGILSTSRYDVIKKLKEEMQDSNTNGLSNDTTGHAIRANNEEELGKLYEPKRMVQQVQIRQALTAAELPKLGQNTSILPGIGQLEENNRIGD